MSSAREWRLARPQEEQPEAKARTEAEAAAKAEAACREETAARAARSAENPLARRSSEGFRSEQADDPEVHVHVARSP